MLLMGKKITRTIIKSIGLYKLEINFIFLCYHSIPSLYTMLFFYIPDLKLTLYDSNLLDTWDESETVNENRIKPKVIFPANLEYA